MLREISCLDDENHGFNPPPPPLILGGPGTDKILDFRVGGGEGEGGFYFRFFQGDLIFLILYEGRGGLKRDLSAICL